MTRIFIVVIPIWTMLGGIVSAHSQVRIFSRGHLSMAMPLNQFRTGLTRVVDKSPTGQSLKAIQVPTMPAASISAIGSTVSNTSWINNDISPTTFILKNTTWSVCPSGCRFSNPLEAWHAALAASFFNAAILTIKISDGVYNITSQFSTNTTKTNNVKIVGNPTDSSKVILNFTNIKGTNLNGFYAFSGGIIGLIDGITINGINAIMSTSSSGATWSTASYGAGIYAIGNSIINLGTHVTINKFYYSGLADYGGRILAPNGGVIATYAGDANFLARHNGSIDCEGCNASYAADTTWAANPLGCNYMAEDGGEINVTGSTGRYSLIGAVCTRTGGHGWAINFKGQGGLGGKVGSGVDVWENGVLLAAGSSFTNYGIGGHSYQGALLSIDSASFIGNSGDGLFADGGTIVGNNVTIRDNGGFGIHLIHQGEARLYNTNMKNIGNKNGKAFVETSGNKNGYSYSSSSLYMQ